MGYEAIALLTEPSDLTLDEVAARLKRRFASEQEVEIQIQSTPVVGRYIEMCLGNWSFRVYYEDDPHVLDESKEIAEQYGASRPDVDRIAACEKRITVASDDDPEMDRFNDYCFILETLEELPGIVLFDPQGEEFMES